MPDDIEVNGTYPELSPGKFLAKRSSQSRSSNDRKNVALIMLHSPIDQFEYFYRLYNHASFLICADGAANRLSKLLATQFPNLEHSDALRQALPDAIHGDLDSIDDKVRKEYEQLGVEISQDPDQYSTDFGKTISKVVERMPDVQDVLVLGSIGGRVDQGIGLLAELYREQTIEHPGLRFWLFSESSISVLLKPGSTVLHTPLDDGLLRRNIGILPVYGPAIISLKGLEWDVEDWATEMGGQMSTSNHIFEDRIVVTTNHYVLFTVERAPLDG